MALYKSNNNWTAVPNSILSSDKITMAEKGMWAYLNSKPDGWNFAIDRIAKEICEKKDAVRRILVKMEKSGILKRERNFARSMDYYLLSPEEDIAHIRSIEICNDGKSQSVSNTEYNSNTDTKDIKTKANTIKVRKQKFLNDSRSKWLELGGNNYMPEHELIKFIDYWTEHKPQQKRFKAEANKFFDIGKRLGTWKSNSNNNYNSYQQQKLPLSTDVMPDDELYL